MNWKEKLYHYYVSSEQAGNTNISSESLFSSNQPYVDKLINNHFPQDKNCKILDVGCGHGGYIYIAKKMATKMLKA